jgi:hypothetical protein
MSETVSIRNKSGADLYVPSLGREVAADEVVEVLAELAEPLVCQSIWEAVKAKKAADGHSK